MVLFTVTDLDTIKHRYKLNSCGVCGFNIKSLVINNEDVSSYTLFAIRKGNSKLNLMY